MREQIDFFIRKKSEIKACFGGSHLGHNPKNARPISTKELMHVVLKSDLAAGGYSFLKIERSLISLLHKLGAQMSIEIKDIVVMSNHIHLLLRVKIRRSFQNFLRAASGLIARKVLGSQKGRKSTRGKLFKGRPFSRIVARGRKSFRTIRTYFELNRLEKCGFTKSESRAWRLAEAGP